MQIIGEKVTHRAFGVGIITSMDNNHIAVRFDNIKEEKKFQYPDAFEKFLKFSKDDLQIEALALMKKNQEKQQIDKQKRIEEMHKREYEEPISIPKKTQGRRTKKLPQRKNLAFKLNYCDGGASEDSIGYKGVCSDDMIRYNIEKAKRSWCSYEGCPCKQYHDGLITREELDQKMDDGGFTCYESIALSNWIAHAGTNLRGENEGKARRLPNAQRGSLAVLTTRYPGDNEKDRIIVGVFIIDAAFEGDDSEEGTVSARSKYKIEIRKSETKALRFWNYYKNEGTPESIRWGTGLYRFLKDEDALRLLEDIVKEKYGKEDYGLAVDILNYYKELHE